MPLRGFNPVMRGIPSWLALAVAICLLAGGTALAGGLDRGFGDDGRVRTDFGGPGDFASGVAIDRHGRTVAAGGTDAFPGEEVRFAIARYLPDGELDPTFGSDGRVDTDFSPDVQDSNDGSFATSVAIDGQGRTLAAGTAGYFTGDDDAYEEFALARYRRDGSLDPSFSGDGLAIYSAGGNRYYDSFGIRDLGIDDRGRILVVGTSFDCCDARQATVARFRPDGSRDERFGKDGIRRLALPRWAYGTTGSELAVGGSGGSTVIGTSDLKRGGNVATVFRLDPDGDLNRDFGRHGFRIIPVRGRETGTAVAIDGRGRIIAAGYTRRQGDEDFFVARILPSGALDEAFAADGVRTIDLGGDDVATSVELDRPRERIVLSGSTREPGEPLRIAVARLTKTGRLDRSFSPDGSRIAGFPGSGVSGYDAAVDDADRITVVGSAGGDFAVARFPRR